MDNEQNQIIQIGEELQRLRNELLETRNSINKIQGHNHSGYDFPQVSGRDLLGFRVNTVTTASVAPTFGASAGIIVIQKDSSNTYLWANTGGAWKSVQLS